ncbi:tripartite tricarboxylate transporter permease [Salipiger profundus]|uniref:tripartite tricarboxylate transporter permease n=1 Tax=Salipiger profundus TaxID=1229727 RepID=UPI0008E6BC86|nr:tripartite tricarboxylate transporter permease [Salipiger profundus]SFD94422.1 putative tricarboxylic transport membrane protein [Salipiger profundus]
MDFSTIMEAAAPVFSLQGIFWMFLGSLAGVFLGAVPGISSGMAVALLLPLTYSIGALYSVVFLAAVFVGVGYGGGLTAILLNAPGSPENSATTLDGYALTKQGRAGEAIGLANMSSLIGGTFSYFVLLFGVGSLANIALKFGPTELFVISMMGVFILGVLGTGSLYKTLASGFLGLLIGTIGLVPTGEWRGTFGSMFLAEGVQIIPVLIGTFVISEILIHIRDGFVSGNSGELSGLRQIFVGMRDCLKFPATIVRSSLIGCLIGIVPAAGATLASFASYSWAKATTKGPNNFGEGRPEGVIAAECANNACYGGALLTALSLGVPGSVTTAILLSALTLHGVQPGPRLLITDGPLIYGLIISAMVAQFFMVFLSVGAGSFFSRLLQVRSYILMPMLAFFAILGTFALRNAEFDIWTMFLFGVLGFWMKNANYSPAALVMGVVLGPIADNEMVRMLQLYGHDWPMTFVTQPIALGLIIAFAIVIAYFVTIRIRNRSALSDTDV